MLPERPPSRSEHLLRSALQRSPHPHLHHLPPSPRAHRRRHSHVPGETSTTTADDDELYRAAFLYRTAATASSPIRPYSRHHSPSPSRPASPSPSRRQSLQRSPASDGNLGLQRHNSIPARKKPSSLVAEPLPLTPHEQVLRARLERVLITGRVVDEREQSRERRTSRDRDDVPGWPWSDHHSMTGSTPPKSSASGSSDNSNYPFHYPYQYQTPHHHRSRSKTDAAPPPPHTTPVSPRRATTSYSTKSPSRSRPPRNNSSGTTTVITPPLTADASPVLSQGSDLIQPQSQQQHQLIDPDDMRLLTPPPTPPLIPTSTGPGSNKRRGSAMYKSPRDSTEHIAPHSPYMYPYKRREVDGSVEQFDLGIGMGGHSGTMTPTSTFNARKASERCRMMEGYVSFAAVEGLGLPPDGVDDDEDKKNGGDEEKNRDDMRLGKGIIGTWARKLFVGIGSGASTSTNPNPTTTKVS